MQLDNHIMSMMIVTLVTFSAINIKDFGYSNQYVLSSFALFSLVCDKSNKSAIDLMETECYKSFH